MTDPVGQIVQACNRLLAEGDPVEWGAMAADAIRVEIRTMRLDETGSKHAFVFFLNKWAADLVDAAEAKRRKETPTARPALELAFMEGFARGLSTEQSVQLVGHMAGKPAPLRHRVRFSFFTFAGLEWQVYRWAAWPPGWTAITDGPPTIDPALLRPRIAEALGLPGT